MTVNSEMFTKCFLDSDPRTALYSPSKANHASYEAVVRLVTKHGSSIEIFKPVG